MHWGDTSLLHKPPHCVKVRFIDGAETRNSVRHSAKLKRPYFVLLFFMDIFGIYVFIYLLGIYYSGSEKSDGSKLYAYLFVCLFIFLWFPGKTLLFTFRPKSQKILVLLVKRKQKSLLNRNFLITRRVCVSDIHVVL